MCDVDRYRADTKLRAGKLDQALLDVKKAMELDSACAHLYRYVKSVIKRLKVSLSTFLLLQQLTLSICATPLTSLEKLGHDNLTGGCSCHCRIRGEVKLRKKDISAAHADLNKALEMQSNNAIALR